MVLPGNRNFAGARRATTVRSLESGDRLDAEVFLRRCEDMPEGSKAELIHGIVYMLHPVAIEDHGEPDSLIQTWLGAYAIATPGTRSATNATLRLGPNDVPQPDGLLRILPECGGQSRVEGKFLAGAPNSEWRWRPVRFPCNSRCQAIELRGGGDARIPRMADLGRRGGLVAVGGRGIRCSGTRRGWNSEERSVSRALAGS